MARPRPGQSYRHTLGILALGGAGAMVFALGVRVGTERLPMVGGGTRYAPVTRDAFALVPAPDEVAAASVEPVTPETLAPPVGPAATPSAPPSSGDPAAPAAAPSDATTTPPAPIPLLDTPPLLDPLVGVSVDLPVDPGGLGGTLDAVEQVANLAGGLRLSVR